jgi:4-methylaminobutanoate oxidase (formaldehyde-forming)
MGWERANVFAPHGVEPEIEYTWDKPNWLPWSAAEHRATRNDVALCDQTSFGKLLIKGSDAEELLQWLCTADVAVEPGRAVYTRHAQRPRRLRGRRHPHPPEPRRVPPVTSAGSAVRDLDWITRHIRPGSNVAVVDVTSAYAVCGVMGPNSRALLQSLSRRRGRRPGHLRRVGADHRCVRGAGVRLAP